MVLFYPEHCVGEQEALYLRASVVEYQSAPLGMFGLFVEHLSVEPYKSVVVAAEVRRHPVKYYSYACLMSGVYQLHQLLGRSVARSRRVVSCKLITPGIVQRMLHYRHYLQVGVAHLLCVGHKVRRYLRIGAELLFLRAVGMPLPGAQMHFVDVLRLPEVIAARAPVHPFAVVPFVVQPAYH